MTAGKGTYRDVPPESFEERNKSWDEHGHSLKSISNEMNKCTILCANCHRKHHDGLINGSSFTTLSIEPDNYTEEI